MAQARDANIRSWQNQYQAVLVEADHNELIGLLSAVEQPMLFRVREPGSGEPAGNQAVVSTRSRRELPGAAASHSAGQICMIVRVVMLWTGRSLARNRYVLWGTSSEAWSLSISWLQSQRTPRGPFQKNLLPSDSILSFLASHI
jgi:hypothetical protein